MSFVGPDALKCDPLVVRIGHTLGVTFPKVRFKQRTVAAWLSLLQDGFDKGTHNDGNASVMSMTLSQSVDRSDNQYTTRYTGSIAPGLGWDGVSREDVPMATSGGDHCFFCWPNFGKCHPQYVATKYYKGVTFQ